MAISDCWSDVLRSTYDTSLVLFHDYRKGLVSPGLDRFARVAAASGTLGWGTGLRGKGLQFGTTGVLTIADAGATPELQLAAAGTILAFGDFTPEESQSQHRPVSKRTVGGTTNYELFFGPAAPNQLDMFDGVTVPILAVPTLRHNMLGSSWVSGVAPRFYTDGWYAGLGSAVINTVATGDPLYIGWNPGFLPFAIMALRSMLHSMLIFNTQLTGTEIAQLYTDFEESAFAL